MNIGKPYRSIIYIILCLSIISLLFTPVAAEALSPLIQFRNEFLQLAKDAEKCAVSVTAVINPGEQSEAGPYIEMVNSAAGLVFDEHHVIVNSKVVNGSKDINIKFYNNITQKAKIVGTDQDYGLTLLHVDDNIDSLLHPEIKSESSKVEPGEPVLMLSNSLDVMPAVAFGIINCTRNDGMIQMSGEMPAGTGGGAVFDFYGRLVGLIAAEINFFPDEISFSSDIAYSKTILIYPINEIKRVAEALLARAKENPVYLGIIAADWPSQLGGAHVKQVFANSPAFKSGFRLGDIVLSINNHKVASAYDLFQEISSRSPGDDVRFEILRGEQIKDIIVKVTSPPAASNTQVQSSLANNTTTRQNINKDFLLLRIQQIQKEMKRIELQLQNEK
jgi:S1-C subfamily serine protease